MPKLIMFAACEKVIHATDNSISLVGLLQGFNAEVPTVDFFEQLGADAKFMMTWFCFSSWEREQDEEGRLYELSYTLTDPAGSNSTLSSGPLTFEKRFHRHWTKVVGFPVKVAGEYSINLMLRPADDPSPARLVATYPLSMVHKVAAASADG